ncbi:MAG: hypothetical protein PVJ27_11845 [Candidatus Brocadiaceae bacterium]|jgi:hypothetical protein
MPVKISFELAYASGVFEDQTERLAHALSAPCRRGGEGKRPLDAMLLATPR